MGVPFSTTDPSGKCVEFVNISLSPGARAPVAPHLTNQGRSQLMSWRLSLVLVLMPHAQTVANSH